MAMLKFAVGVGLLLVGCVPTVLADDGECSRTGDENGDVSVEQRLRGPNCNGDTYAAQCASAGAPSGYGVDADCTAPARPKGDGLCTVRHTRDGCVVLGRILCCP